MTHSTLGRLLERLLEDIEGQEGFWHGQRDDVTVYVVSDLEHDRMRITPDLGGSGNTESFADAVIAQLPH